MTFPHPMDDKTGFEATDEEMGLGSTQMTDNPTQSAAQNSGSSVKFHITEEIARKCLAIVDKGLVSGLGVRKPGEFCVEAAICYALDLPHGDDPGCVSPVLRSLKIRLNDSSWSSKKARAKGLRRLALAQLGSKDHLDEKEFRRRVVDLALRVSVPAALRSAASVQKDEKHKAALCEAANRCEKEGTRQAAIDARAIARDAADAAAAAAAYDAAAAAYAAAAAAAYADAYTYAAAAAAYDAAYADAAAAAYAAAAAARKSARDKSLADYAAAAAAAYAAARKSARDKSLADYAESVVQILIEMKAPGCQWLSLTEAA